MRITMSSKLYRSTFPNLAQQFANYGGYLNTLLRKHHDEIVKGLQALGYREDVEYTNGGVIYSKETFNFKTNKVKYSFNTEVLGYWVKYFSHNRLC